MSLPPAPAAGRSIFAVHTWIVLKPANAESYTRYDVTGFGRPLRINGYPPDSYWIGNRPEMIAAIGGERAAAAIPKIEQAIKSYAYIADGAYRLWPGPNSNTFVATVLRAVPELEVAMPPKDFRADGSLFGLTESETGVEMSLYGVLGLKVGRVEGLEVNFLSLVAGLDTRRPAVKIPAFGRIGLDRAQARASPLPGHLHRCRNISANWEKIACSHSSSNSSATDFLSMSAPSTAYI
jgi:hypothetical protein